MPRHNCDNMIITCHGTNVCEQQTCLGTKVCGHKRVLAQTCLGTYVRRHKHVWAQKCVSTNVSGHERVCMGSSMYGAQTCGLKSTHDILYA